MKVVLRTDVPKVGYRGDVVKVRDGFFRNFLSPRDLADAATPALLKLSELRKEKRVMKAQQVLENAKEVLEKLKGLKVSIKAKASEKGRLFASVTENDVIDAIEKKAKVRLEREFLKMAHFKETGKYDVLVHLGKDMEETVKVEVKAAA
ncbi:MAG: 50S ribosomal protein L9 [Candidatus Gracilibacteria bacterium]